MLKNKILLGIILSIILLVSSISGFTAYYKYTQESGTNFYVGAADKADALEDTNEMRQIIDDLGALLIHSKRNDLYPKDATTGGTIQIPETGLKFSNDPVNNDIAAYIAGEMTWQTKAELGFDLTLYYLKTEINTLSKVETIYGVNITDSTELATALTDYYLKTAIDSLSEMETIWGLNVTTSTEMATALTDYYLKTAIDSQAEVEAIWGVSLANDSELHTQNTDTDLNATFEATFFKKADSIGDIGDVDLTDIANGKILKYNSTSTNWECEDETGGGASQLSDLSDVGVTTPTDKYVLVADGDSWESRAISSDDLSDRTTIAMLDENETVTGNWALGVATATSINGLTLSAVDTDHNTFIGKDAGLNLVAGAQYNTFLGQGAGKSAAEGGTIAADSNTAVGYNALFSNTIGDQNVAMGQTSLTDNTEGRFNVAVGYDNLANNTTGNKNTGLGYDALYYNTTGSNNTAIGADAGLWQADGETALATPENSVYIGAGVRGFNNDDSNSIVIGYNAIGKGANTVVLGNDSITETYLKGNVAMTVGAINFANALDSDHLYSGDVDSQPVGESVVFGQLLYFNWTDKEWKLAKADALITMPGLRIALETKADSEICLMLVKGYIRDDSAFEFAGAMIYISAATAGAMTSTAPSTAGNQLQRVGQAKSADILFFDPSIDVGEI